LEGIYYGRDPQRHEQIFRAFLHATPILPLTESGMERFAHIRGELRAKGQLIIMDPGIWTVKRAKIKSPKNYA